jgi:hypothetical protein
MVVITIWLPATKYPFLKWQWIFYFLRDVSFLYHCQDFCRAWLYIWVARWVSYKTQELLTLREHFISPPFCSVLLVLVFLSCPIMCLYVLTSVWFVLVCVLWCPTHIVLCFCFVFICLMYPMLPVSLDCPFRLPFRYSLIPGSFNTDVAFVLIDLLILLMTSHLQPIIETVSTFFYFRCLSGTCIYYFHKILT